MPSITANGRPKRGLPKPRAHARETRSDPEAAKPPQAPEPLTHPDDEVHCLRQVEFYFSDCNLPFDEFLWGHHSKPGGDRWVPLSVIATFNRVRRFFDKYGTHWVIYVLRKSARLLEVDVTRQLVRRKPAVPGSAVSGWCRSVYVKGFGRGAAFKGTKTELLNFFAGFAYVNVLDMRRERAEPHEFKGSVFVEFADVLEAEAFLALQMPPRWKGAELVTMAKQAYCVMKCTEKNLPKAYVGIPKTTDCDRYLRRNKFDAFKPNPRPPPPPRPGKYDANEAYMVYKNVAVRVWRPGEGLPAGVKFQGDLSKWQHVKEVPFVANSTLEMCCANDIARYVKLIKTSIDRVTHEKVFVAYVSHIPKHRPKRAHIFFKEAVSDEVILRIKKRLPQLGTRNIVWARADMAKEHALQLQDANRLARRALGGLTKADKALDEWPLSSAVEHGKLFLVTKDVAANKLSGGKLCNKRAFEDISLTTDAGPPAAKRVKLELPDSALLPLTPANLWKRARDAGSAVPPNKKPRLESPLSLSSRQSLGHLTFDEILKLPLPEGKPEYASLSAQRLQEFAASLGVGTPVWGRKRERRDDDETPGAGPSTKKLKTEPAP